MQLGLQFHTVWVYIGRCVRPGWVRAGSNVMFSQKVSPSQVVPCRSSEALLTKQAAAAVQGLDLAAGMRNRLQLLLDLHAAAGAPVTQQALSLFVTALCLVKVSRVNCSVSFTGASLLLCHDLSC